MKSQAKQGFLKMNEEKLAKFFSAMADPTRLRIIKSIAKESLSVNDISKTSGVSLSAASHQLRQLYDLDLVMYEKKGREKFYTVSDNHVRRVLREGLEHIERLPRP